MNKQITFCDVVELGEGDRTITVTLDKATCMVRLETAGDDDETFASQLSWEQMADAELLAGVFANERVKTFKTLVTLLGKVHGFKERVEDIL
jgi:hypothetical protein